MDKSNEKPTNPKDSVGIKKVGTSMVPQTVIAEVGLAILEGARKYGRHNYREKGVRASVYVDAVFRHLMLQWWEGEDLDADSGISHITKAIAGLVVLRDSMIQGNWVDDRPPKSPSGFTESLNEKAATIVEKYPDPMDAVTENNIGCSRVSMAEYLHHVTTPSTVHTQMGMAPIDPSENYVYIRDPKLPKLE